MSDILEEVKEREQEAEVSAPATPAAKPAPELKYTEVSDDYYARPKKRRKVAVVLIVLLIIAVLAVVAVGLGLLGNIAFENVRIKDITELPEGAAVPVFAPIDPAEFTNAVDDERIVVPDETGLALSSDGEAPAAAYTPPKNHYVQTPNVSEFYAHAAQDESYVYFLQYVTTENKHIFYDLMRMRISTGKTEPVSNANEISGSIYSFALWGQNIITCELKRDTGTFAFYRVPKAFEDAQLLFEHDSAAYMNVHDNKIFMLFTESGELGIFDPAVDTKPTFIDMQLTEDGTHYFPEFSVVNGYLYYCIRYDGGDRLEYLRRSLYTGETISLLSCEDGNFIRNPCWDDNGTAYYGSYDQEKLEFNLTAKKSGGSPQDLEFPDFGGAWPLIAIKDEALIAVCSPNTIYKYNRDDLSLESEVSVNELPYAVTKDFLVAPDGVYRLFDLSFIPFSK